MARARNIKPGICLNDVLAGLQHWVRLLFVYLWTICDRAGRLADNPKRIGAALFPYEPELPIDEGLQQLHDGGFVRRYTVAGERFIQVVNWNKHQHPHPKEPASMIPEPATETSTEPVTEKPRLVTAFPRQATEKPERAGLIPDTGFLIPDTGGSDSMPGRADGALPLDAFFEERYSRHPKKRDRILAEQALAGIPGIETNQVQEELRRGHEAWIATDDYTWKGGAKCPTFAEFITDRTWKYLPPATAGLDDGGESVIDRAIADWRRGTEREAA